MGTPTRVTALPRSSLQRSFASLLLGVLLLSIPLHAQEGIWSVSASGNGSLMFLKDVDRDGENDVEDYSRDYAIPIAKYPPLRFGYGFETHVGYRFERDMGIRFFGGYTRVTTETAFQNPDTSLSLQRLISSTDFGFDISYYFPPLIYNLEVSTFVGIGRMRGFAEQSTYRTHLQKTSDSTGLVVITFIDEDAYSYYEKSKLFVRVGGEITWHMTESFVARIAIAYKHAPLGQMDGTLREFTNERPHTTTIPFNFSTLDLKVGLVVEL